MTNLCTKTDWAASPQVQVTMEPTPESITNFSFGKQQWEAYFGDIGEEPPLPQDIHKILLSPCPFWPDKKIFETHLCVLVPATVNGKPLTLNSLQELIQNPKRGYETKYRTYDAIVQNELGNMPTTSHWILMTREAIPCSRGKLHEEQKESMMAYAEKNGWNYELPMALDAAVCILMEHAKTGTRLYGGDYEGGGPATYTRCQETVNIYKNEWWVGIGCFSPTGLCIYNPFPFSDYDGGGQYGAAGCLKFS